MVTRFKNMNLMLVVSAALMAWALEPSHANPRPNILFMTADDMHWDSVGVYRSPVRGISPNLDRLAKEGILFRHAFVQIAICTPSRQVMLSGNHSHQTLELLTILSDYSPAVRRRYRCYPADYSCCRAYSQLENV